MFKSLTEKLKAHKWFLLIAGIILVGIFLRTYHFSDWLLFEIDQTYDTRIVSQAIQNGPAELPLLGPTAGGGRALRLGPAFYYLEYGSALLFGDTPVGHALLVLICSIASLPLFYLFIRKYFSPGIVLALLALFSTSVYLVLYGRFSWSPNVLPFLMLLTFYALLRSVGSSEPHRDRWFLITSLATALTSQIHFNVFFTLPPIVILFLLYKRPRFQIKTWLIALGIIALVSSPMILSDLDTHGENIGYFFKKIGKAGGSPLNMLKGFPKKFSVDLNYTASNYFFINSGIDRINGGRLKEYGFQNNANLPWRILAIILFLAELSLLTKNIFRGEASERRDFLVLVLLWVAIPFAYFYTLISGTFQIYPRFFLPLAPAALILFGLLLEKLQPEKNKLRHLFLVIIIAILLVPHLVRIGNHFAQLATPGRGETPVETEDIFPNDKRLTLKEQLAITEYILAHRTHPDSPIYLDAIHEYEPVFWYHLSKEKLFYTGNINEDYLYEQGNYFLIKFSGKGINRVLQEALTVSEKKDFGILTVYVLTPRPERIKALKQGPDDSQSFEQTLQIQALRTWSDLSFK